MGRGVCYKWFLCLSLGCVNPALLSPRQFAVRREFPLPRFVPIHYAEDGWYNCVRGHAQGN